ncbi:MAG: mucoidy inhibitor MuiA family protein [Bacteroidota bacterium]
MKKLVALLLLPALMLAGEINPKTVIKEVTVYLSGARVTAESGVTLPAGVSEVRLTGLSPQIDQNSIQVSGLKNVSVLSINYTVNNVAKKLDSEKIKALEAELQQINREYSQIQNIIKGLTNEEALMTNNIKIKGDDQNLTVEQIAAYSKYYRERITAIQNEVYDNNLKLGKIQQQSADTSAELRKLQGGSNEQRGEILLKLDALAAVTITLITKYNVSSAGWFALYDIKTEGIKEPLDIFYNAHVYQNTGENWDDVKITLSTGDPNANNIKPAVQPHYLNFVNSYATTTATSNYNYKYNPTIKTVTGVVFDENGLPLPGANVYESGTSRGVATDIDGRYTLAITSGQKLAYSYIGYVSQELPIYAQQMNVTLAADQQQLDEVVVIGYGRSSNDDSEYSTASATTVKKEEITTSTGDVKEMGIAHTTFKITKSYSIPSTTEVTVIAIDKFELPAEYEYFTAPLINENVFLTAKVKDWEKYDILPGEANVYFEGSYAGKTFIDPNLTTEDLTVSLGTDPTIIVERKEIDDTKAKSFLGGNRIVSKNYEISIRNNKATDVSLVVMDRIPVSQNKAIKVDEVKTGGAEYDEKKGLLTWKVSLKAKESIKKQLSYEVRYPKEKKVNMN